MKFFNHISLLVIALTLSIVVASAAITPGTIPRAGDLGITQDSPIKDVPGAVKILGAIVHWAYIIFFIVAVLFILFAAYNYLRGAGVPENVKKAQQGLLYAAIAIVIALMAVGVEAIVKNFLEQQRPTGTAETEPPLNVSYPPPSQQNPQNVSQFQYPPTLSNQSGFFFPAGGFG